MQKKFSWKTILWLTFNPERENWLSKKRSSTGLKSSLSISLGFQKNRIIISSNFQIKYETNTQKLSTSSGTLQTIDRFQILKQQR
jgi:hypothetical protein